MKQKYLPLVQVVERKCEMPKPSTPSRLSLRTEGSFLVVGETQEDIEADLSLVRPRPRPSLDGCPECIHIIHGLAAIREQFVEAKR